MSIASSITSLLGSPKPVTAAFGLYSPEFGEAVGDLQAFQYFPEKISDSKGVEYASRTVPGGSHPIYTFISGGERTLSFDVIFANDKNPEPPTLTGLFSGKAAFDASSNARQDVSEGTSSIPEAIKWLRSFLYPEFGITNDAISAPPLAMFYLPNSGIVGTGNVPDSIIGILTQANVSYEVFHRNGAPRLVVISVELKEVAQISKTWQWQTREELLGAEINRKRFWMPKYTRATIGNQQGDMKLL